MWIEVIMRNKLLGSMLAAILLAAAMSAAGCESSSLHPGMPSDMQDLPIRSSDTNVSVKQAMGDGR